MSESLITNGMYAPTAVDANPVTNSFDTGGLEKSSAIAMNTDSYNGRSSSSRPNSIQESLNSTASVYDDPGAVQVAVRVDSNGNPIGPPQTVVNPSVHDISVTQESYNNLAIQQAGLNDPRTRYNNRGVEPANLSQALTIAGQNELATARADAARAGISDQAFSQAFVRASGEFPTRGGPGSPAQLQRDRNVTARTREMLGLPPYTAAPSAGGATTTQPAGNAQAGASSSNGASSSSGLSAADNALIQNAGLTEPQTRHTNRPSDPPELAPAVERAETNEFARLRSDATQAGIPDSAVANAYQTASRESQNWGGSNSASDHQRSRNVTARTRELLGLPPYSAVPNAGGASSNSATRSTSSADGSPPANLTNEQRQEAINQYNSQFSSQGSGRAVGEVARNFAGSVGSAVAAGVTAYLHYLISTQGSHAPLHSEL